MYPALVPRMPWKAQYHAQNIPRIHAMNTIVVAQPLMNYNPPLFLGRSELPFGQGITWQDRTEVLTEWSVTFQLASVFSSSFKNSPAAVMVFSRLCLCALITAVPLVTAFPGILIERQSDLLKKYDYVIVGGGTSGLTVGNRLSENPRGRLIAPILIPRCFPS